MSVGGSPHEPQVRRKTEFDVRVDPPPDLALEIEITSSLVNRVNILAAMKVPEIWRFNGAQLRFCILQANGQYAEAPVSRSFPFLRPDHLMPFLSMSDDIDETTRIRTFMKWLREGI